MYLLDHLIQAGHFLTQYHRDSVNQSLINHFTARRFTDAGITGVIGKNHNIAGEICVVRTANIEQHAVMPGHRDDLHIGNNGA